MPEGIRGTENLVGRKYGLGRIARKRAKELKRQLKKVEIK